MPQVAYTLRCEIEGLHMVLTQFQNSFFQQSFIQVLATMACWLQILQDCYP